MTFWQKKFPNNYIEIYVMNNKLCDILNSGKDFLGKGGGGIFLK